MATRMQQRRGTATQWTTANPTLNAGELGWESDTNKFKIGDGTNLWANLDYFADINSTANPAFGSSITFEGATANDYETILAVTDPTADRTITFPDATGTVALTSDIAVTASSTTTFSNKSISLGSNTVTSTLAQLNTAITDADVASLAGAETLTNKTIALGSNTISGTISQFNTAVTDQDLATLAGTETLTNKTLTTPVISSITNTGTLTLPTTTGTVALTSDITTAINNLVDGAPAALDTLNELAAAINDDASYAGTITSALGLKAPLASPTFTGTVTLADGAVLGTPLSGTLTNATGLPVATGISGLGTGVATFLATPSSANLAAALTDEIGTGNVLLSDMATSAQTASYTLVLTDKAKVVEMSNASANNLTVPLNATVAFPVGTQIHMVQTGAGQTTVVATGGVTINSATTLKIRAQWGAATLIKRAENTWVLVGDLATS
jgi:hypothetical protein